MHTCRARQIVESELLGEMGVKILFDAREPFRRATVAPPCHSDRQLQRQRFDHQRHERVAGARLAKETRGDQRKGTAVCLCGCVEAYALFFQLRQPGIVDFHTK